MKQQASTAKLHIFSPGRPWFWLALGAACLVLTGLLRLLCGTAAGDGVRNFAAGLSGVLSFCFSFSRRPIGEWLLPIVVLGIPTALLFGAIRGKARGFFLWLSRMVALCCAILLLFMAAFGVQYTGPDLADTMGLETGSYTLEQLKTTLTVLAEEINRVAPTVPRDAEGECDFGEFDSMANAVMNAYRHWPPNTPRFPPSARQPPKRRCC